MTYVVLKKVVCDGDIDVEEIEYESKEAYLKEREDNKLLLLKNDKNGKDS